MACKAIAVADDYDADDDDNKVYDESLFNMACLLCKECATKGIITKG